MRRQPPRVAKVERVESTQINPELRVEKVESPLGLNLSIHSGDFTRRFKEKSPKREVECGERPDRFPMAAHSALLERWREANRRRGKFTGLNSHEGNA